MKGKKRCCNRGEGKEDGEEEEEGFRGRE